MSFLASYPLTVYVANTFDPNEHVILNVKYHRMLKYYAVGTGAERQFKLDPGPEPGEGKDYPISGGERIGFPLDLASEYLEITLRGNVTISKDYYIQAGAKAKCSFSPDFAGKLFYWEKDGVIQNPEIKTYFKGEVETVAGEKVQVLNEMFYAGGKWKVPAGSANDWKLKIKKYNFDPEEDDVVIGPATPG